MEKGGLRETPSECPLPFLTALASKHIDLKQMELDTAVAKVDELSKQLESLWTESPGQSPLQLKVWRPEGAGGGG